jgi:2-iminobutanoate/2-iminopropanoate deaminase
MTKHKFFPVSAGVALVALAVACSAQRKGAPAQTTAARTNNTNTRRLISPAGVAVNPNLSNGMLVNNTLYVAGMQGTDASGNLVKGGIEPQTHAALENIGAILRAAGFSVHDVVSVNVYLANVNDYQAMNKAYDQFFPNPRPTRTTIQAGAIVGGARIEISAIAVKP